MKDICFSPTAFCFPPSAFCLVLTADCLLHSGFGIQEMKDQRDHQEMTLVATTPFPLLPRGGESHCQIHHPRSCESGVLALDTRPEIL
jgi:hypothetical protein